MSPVANVRRQATQLPLVALATTCIFGLPLAILWALSEGEAVTSLALLAAIALALALAASAIGEAIARRFGRQLNELMVWGWLRAGSYERRLDRAWAQIVRADENSPRAIVDAFRELTEALEAADAYTSGHSRRVSSYCERIARQLRLTPAEMSHLRIAAAIHDVGKINTPPEILRKPAPLTEAEYETIKRHTVDGASMVDRLADPRLTRAVRHHHERLDGSGYPDGLANGEIPIESRIIAVADAFDAITSNRPYRPGRPRRAALEILAAESGSRLDPEVVAALNTRQFSTWSALTSLPERGIAAMGGARNALSASTTGAIVAVIAILGIGVTNPEGVASAVQATQIPSVIESIVPGGGDDEEGEGSDDDREPLRLAATGATAAAAPVTASSPAARNAGKPNRSGSGSPVASNGAGKQPSQPTKPPSPPPASPPGPPPPEPPPPAPPREPRPLDPVLDLLPQPLGDALKNLTDPLLPPAPPAQAPAEGETLLGTPNRGLTP